VVPRAPEELTTVDINHPTQIPRPLKVARVDVDTAPHIAQHDRAQSIPTLLWIRNGEMRRSQVGALPPSALIEWVTATLDEP
jgi:thioredoxin-like negative regulator of GroEL